jgi:hypothetical protein
MLRRESTPAGLDLLDFRTALAHGTDIGSGPTEATRESPTLRLKGSDVECDRDRAASMMNLTAMCDSRQADADWAKAA